MRSKLGTRHAAAGNRLLELGSTVDQPLLCLALTLLRLALLRGFLALDAAARVTGRPAAIEKSFGRAPRHHGIGHGIGLAFVVVTGGAHAAVELYTPPLLHHVGGLVGGGMQIGRATKSHVLSGGVRHGAHLLAGSCRRPADMRLDIAQVMARPEGRLYLVRERHRLATAAHTFGRSAVHLSRCSPGVCAGLGLHRRNLVVNDCLEAAVGGIHVRGHGQFPRRLGRTRPRGHRTR